MTIHRPLTKLEDILERQSDGEAIGGMDCSFQSALILATRYLISGPDTVWVQSHPINWNTWEMVSVVGGDLPKNWQVMGKGLLLNYFGWRKERNKEIEFDRKLRKEVCDQYQREKKGKHISQGYVCDTCAHIHFADCHNGKTGWGPTEAGA